MKHFISGFLFTVFLLVALAIPVQNGFAQDWNKFATNNFYLSYTVTQDSLTTVNSNPFTLATAGYDRNSFPISWFTYPFHIEISNSAASGTPKITTFVQGSYDKSNYTNIDTIGTADSVSTLQYRSIDLNNKKYPFYRIQTKGVTTNPAAVTTTIRMYHPSIR